MALLSFIASSEAMAQPDTSWTQIYGGGPVDHFLSSQLTSDSGFIMVGPRGSSEFDLWNYWIVKTDKNGDTLWTKMLGGSSSDFPAEIKETNDGGYIIIGVSESFGPGSAAFYVVKVNKDGDEEWSNTYGGNDFDFGGSVAEIPVGGFILTGSSGSFGNDLQMWVVRIDSVGDTLWTKSYGGIAQEGGNSIKRLDDGSFLVAGFTDTFGFGKFDMWVVKLTETGDTSWTKTFGGTEDDIAEDILLHEDGGFLIVGNTSSFGKGNQDIWLVRINSVGDTLWTKTYGGTNLDETKSGVRVNSGGYLIGSTSKSFFDSIPHIWLVRIDDIGDTLWTKSMLPRFSAKSVTTTHDDWFTVAGLAKFQIGEDVHGLLAKIIVKPYTNISADSVWIDDDRDGYASGTLDGNGSWSAEGFDIVSFEWTWNDSIIGIGPVIEFSLPTGNHLVELTTMDENGFSSSKSINIDVYSFRTEIEDAISSHISSIGDSIFLAYSDDNTIYTWNADGALLHVIEIDDDINGALTIGSNGLIYIPTKDSGLYAIDTIGNLIFKSTLGRINKVSPSFSGGRDLYIGNIAGEFLSIDGISGSINWIYDIGIQSLFSPAIGHEGTVYTNGINKDLIALGPTGEMLWSFQTNAWIKSNPAIDQSGNLYFANDRSKFYKISPEGAEIWMVDLSNKQVGSPIIDSGGNIYIETLDGIVHAYDSEGTLLWSYNTSKGVYTRYHDSPVLSPDGRIIVYDRKGNITILRPEGDIDWNFKAEGAINSSPLVTEEGLIIAISGTNKIYGMAIPDLTANADTKGQWSSFQSNNQRTGHQNDVVAVESEQSNLPTEYSLSDNYPNPFNPSSTIEYALPQSGEVSLMVYNLLGEEVIRLVNENQQAGFHKVTWNASNVASGIYFYRLQAGDFVKTRKMVLLK